MISVSHSKQYKQQKLTNSYHVKWQLKKDLWKNAKDKLSKSQEQAESVPFSQNRLRRLGNSE